MQFPSSLFGHIIRIIICICITLALYRRAGIAEIRPEPGKTRALAVRYRNTLSVDCVFNINPFAILEGSLHEGKKNSYLLS